MFDLKKDLWFVRTPTKEIYDAVVKWLFDQDLRLHTFMKEYEALTECGSEASLCGDTDLLVNGAAYGSSSYFESRSKYKEIKLTFKTVVESVEYPVIETEQEIKIRELKETIEKAQKQIDEIISNKK